MLPALCKVLQGQSLRKDNVSALLEPFGKGLERGWRRETDTQPQRLAVLKKGLSGEPCRVR